MSRVGVLFGAVQGKDRKSVLPGDLWGAGGGGERTPRVTGLTTDSFILLTLFVFLFFLFQYEKTFENCVWGELGEPDDFSLFHL